MDARKILLGVDASTGTRRALDYLGRLARAVPGLGVRLLHVEPAVSAFLAEEAGRDPLARERLAALCRKHQEAARRLLEEAREVLLRAGMTAGAIELESRPRREGAAKDLLDAAEEGLFDAVCVGRRGVTRLEELFGESLSRHLLEHSRLIPVWVVDGSPRGEGVLAAVDGSESALRAVDHLAFLFSGAPPPRVVLLHVAPRLRDVCEIDFAAEVPEGLEELVVRGDRRCMEQFVPAAMALLEAAGLAGAVETATATVWHDIADTVLREARERECGTIVLGRRGAGGSFFGGRVTRGVFRGLTDAALWVVP